MDIKSIVPQHHWKTTWPEGVVDNGREDASVGDLPSASKEPVVAEEPRLHYLDVRPAVKGHWPDKKIDDGWDDDTVVAPVALSQQHG